MDATRDGDAPSNNFLERLCRAFLSLPPGQYNGLQWEFRQPAAQPEEHEEYEGTKEEKAHEEPESLPDDDSPNECAQDSKQHESELDALRNPWNEAYARNLNESRFCALPPELIRRVALHMTPSSIYFFRQTCRLFLSHVEERTFSNSIGSVHSDQQGSIWHRLWLNIPRYETVSEETQIRDITQRMLLCKPCRDFRTSGDRDLVRGNFQRTELYCHGCQKEHPRIFFSKQQREHSSPQCLGREGVVRLCTHLAVSWHDLEMHHRYDDPKVFQCTDVSHHLTPRQQTEVGQVSSDWAENKYFPTITATFRGNKGRQHSPRDVHLSWQVIPFELPLIPKFPTSLHAFHRKVQESMGASTVSLCPHKTYEDTSMLCAFDPNHCVCFGRQMVNDHIVPRCCYYNTCCAKHLEAHECRNPLEVLPVANPCSGGRCWTIQHRTQVQHRSICRDCMTEYSWSRQGEQIKLRRTSDFTAKTPLDPEWLCLLDPGSIDFQDSETEHFLWCRDGDCAISKRDKTWLRALTDTVDKEHELREPYLDRVYSTLYKTLRLLRQKHDASGKLVFKSSTSIGDIEYS